MRSLEDITRDLAEVTDDLIAVADGDFAERYRLLTRQDELRQEAGRFHAEFDDKRPAEDIRSELAELSKHRDAEVARMTGRNLMSGPSSSGASAGAVSAEMIKLSLATNPDSTVETLSARISALESILEARGSESDERPPDASPSVADPVQSEAQISS